MGGGTREYLVLYYDTSFVPGGERNSKCILVIAGRYFTIQLYSFEFVKNQLINITFYDLFVVRIIVEKYEY